MTRTMIAAAASVVIVTLGAAAWLSLGSGRPVEDPLAGARSIDAIGADIGGDFALSGHDERIYRSEELIDGPTLLYFGYTFCPDVCPFDTQDMADVADMLAEDGVEVTPVFVTIDPARDTEEQLGYFVDAMHPSMIGLRPDAEQLDRLADDWKVYFQRVDIPKDEGGSDDHYLMNHTSFTYFVLPDEGVVRLFRHDQTPEEMAGEIRTMLKMRGLSG